MEQNPSLLVETERVDEGILAEVLTVFGEGVPDELLKACDLLLTGVPAHLDDIDAALATGGFDEAARIAHSLKGSAGAFGARRLSGLAGRVDAMCRDGAPTSVGPLVEEMRTEFAVFRTILLDRLAGLAR